MELKSYIEFSLYSLNSSSVDVLKQTFMNINGKKVQIEPNERITYINCSENRRQLYNILPIEYVEAILKIWGNEPIVENPFQEIIEENL